MSCGHLRRRSSSGRNNRYLKITDRKRQTAGPRGKFPWAGRILFCEEVLSGGWFSVGAILPGVCPLSDHTACFVHWSAAPTSSMPPEETFPVRVSICLADPRMAFLTSVREKSVR